VAEEGLAHGPVAIWRKYLPLQILNLEVFLLLVDDHCPPAVGKGLSGDVGADVADAGQAEERPLWVVGGVHDVVAVGGLAGLAAEVVVGVRSCRASRALGFSAPSLSRSRSSGRPWAWR